MSGKNPFARWQQAKQESRETLIRECLAELTRKRTRYDYITDLAEEVASYISQKEEKKCDRATILRNKRYKGPLLSFMAKSIEQGTDSINRKNMTEPKAEALVLAAEIGAENLRREVTRLKAYISDLEASKENSEPQRSNSPKTGDVIADIQRRHTLTCQALLAVLKHFDGLLRSDADAKRVMDASTRPHKVVVDEKLATPFFEWMQLNRDVGGTT